jgi:NAD(P)-dependent dehydrogenase (short-subunit alcohol dehydrogenase family)
VSLKESADPRVFVHPGFETSMDQRQLQGQERPVVNNDQRQLKGRPMAPDSVVAITTTGKLGDALATRLAAAGSRIALYDWAMKADHADALRMKLGPDRLDAHAIDFTSWETIRDAIADTKALFGRAPTHAVLVAESWEAGGPLHAGGPDDKGHFVRVTSVTFEAIYRILRLLLPPMIEAGGGSIVVVGPRVAEQQWAGAGAAVYTAAASAALSLVRTAAAEVMQHGVRVNAVLTSISDEPETRAGMPNADYARWVSADSIADVIAFLLSDAARDVTGAAVPVYGRG